MDIDSSETAWTPEPWVCDWRQTRDGVRYRITAETDGRLSHEMADATAARIVACVNALAGLNPAALAGVVEALRAMATREPMTWHENYLSADHMSEMARSALAALREGGK